ncbi:retrovirus-related pol polyprotein from transposon TNT 1-94 [Tanacetum coccineum]
MLPSTTIKSSTKASESKPKSNTRNDRISQPSCSNKKTNKVEAQLRIVKPYLKTKNHVSKFILNANVQHIVLNANSHLVCSSCNECLFDDIHDSCVSDYISDMHARPKSVKSKKKKIWKCIGKIFNTVEYRWIPTGRTFTINGNKCPLTRLTPDSKVPLKKPVTTIVVQPKTHSRNVTISHVYYVEGLGHNLFSVGQFCDSNLEVAFRKHTCFVQNLDGADLLTGSRDTNLYTISLDDMLKTSPICLLSKASKTKSWLWHRRLSHLNFDTLNQLSKDGLARGIPRLKYQKGHLCSACALGKSKKSSHTPKAEDTNQEKLNLLHMDLCGLMRVESINGKKYILVIVDDYSRFTWVKFLRSKDEAPEVIIKCIKNIQVRLNATVRNIRTDNGTEFVNHTLREFYENVGISHQTSVARTPQQNGIVERRNRTLVEAARTMLIFSKAPLFLWFEAINTACYTQNRSLIRHRYNKTPYDLMHDKKPDLSYLHVFGSLCYPTNDSEDLVDCGNRIKLHTKLMPPNTLHRDTSSQESSSNVQLSQTPGGILGKWTKNHPLSNVIGNPSRSVSTRKQLQENAMWCYYDVFLSSVEPKNFKEATKDSCWIEAMQEELHST